MIKLVTIDLDGTLFDDKKNISIENINAIKKARENGTYIVIATGRPLNGVINTLNTLGLNTIDDYVICYNGAKIFNVGTNETIFSSTILGSDVKILYNEAINNKLNYHAFNINDELLTIKHNPYTLVESTINKIVDQEYDFTKTLDDDKFIKAMIVDSEENINKITPIMKKKYQDKYSVVRSSKIFLEFLNKKTNKGLALLELKKYLNIKDDETMAIGDADNDIPMIKCAHIGVAMENAFKEVFTYANFITKSNEESGVAYAINKYINDVK